MKWIYRPGGIVRAGDVTGVEERRSGVGDSRATWPTDGRCQAAILHRTSCQTNVQHVTDICSTRQR